MKRLLDVPALEIGVGLENLGAAHPVRDHVDDRRHRNPEAADTRNAAHLLRSHRDPRKRHLRPPSIAPAAYSTTAKQATAVHQLSGFAVAPVPVTTSLESASETPTRVVAIAVDSLHRAIGQARGPWKERPEHERFAHDIDEASHRHSVRARSILRNEEDLTPWYPLHIVSEPGNRRNSGSAGRSPPLARPSKHRPARS